MQKETLKLKGILHGESPCTCLHLDDDMPCTMAIAMSLKITLEFLYEPNFEYVCEHRNSFVVVRAHNKGPFIEPKHHQQYDRIWVNEG